MRIYLDNDGWNSIHDDLLFTASVLDASGTHAALARPLDALVDEWDGVEAERVAAARSVVRANARVAWLDADLDNRTRRFAGQLLLDCGNDRTHATFARFFPVNVTEVVKLALGSQLDATAAWPALGAALGLPKASATALAAVTAVFGPARAALAARVTAEEAATLVSVKQQAWRERANTQRRVVESSILAWATQHGQPRGYVDTFFPRPKVRTTKATPSNPVNPVEPR